MSGTVSSAEEGTVLPGVNVVVKGTTIGTVTDGSGKYTLSVPASGETLVFTFIGFVSQEVGITGRSTVDVSMASDVQQLTEVVVTATGDQKSARELVYANQTVNAKDLMSSPNKNALEALRGKTAGVKITTGSGSVGASTRIVLRGEASLTGDNNALIVVDGVPIDNTSAFGGEREAEGGFSDFGNRFSDFNPDNIESLTILKGPAATSLYGSRGASGVVVITTKSGSRDRVKVNFNSTTSFERAYILLKRQGKFGQGLINPDGSNNFDSGENFSWGPRFDGVVRPWTSPVDTDGDGDVEWLSRPYRNVDNQLQDFFNTGRTFNNAISVQGGGDKFTFYTSYGNTRQNGILDNSDYERHSIILNASAKFSEKLKSRFSMNYSNVLMNTAQEGGRAFEGQNPYANAVQAPVNIPYTELRDYKNPYHSFTGFYGSYAINPYYILNEYINRGASNNFLGSVHLDYNPIKNLTLSTSIGSNYVSFNRITGVPQYAYTDHFVWEDDLTLTPRGDRQTNSGSYEEYISTSETIDWTSKASYNVNIVDKLNMNAIVGFNYYDVKKRVLLGQTQGGFAVPGIFNLGNSLDVPRVTQAHLARRIMGAFANVGFSYDEKIFLEYSGRNDWSSTLPPGNQSFDYHALGANVILSEYLGLKDNDYINFLKVRSSYGSSGKDAGVYLLSSLYTNNPQLFDFGSGFIVSTPLAGQPATTRNGLIGNDKLQPELTKTFEIGADFAFLKNRVQLAYTYYHSKHENQIVEAELPRSSGYTVTAVNVGLLENKGHEVALTLTPINQPDGLRWDINLTWSKNTSLVKKISDQTDELTILNTGRGVTLVAKEGEPFGSWKGQVKTYSPDGKMIVDANGSPVYTTEAEIAGSTQPDWLGGLSSTLDYKGFRLGFLFDTRQGGQIFSLTKQATEFNGTALTSIKNNRQPFVIPNSVVNTGTDDAPVYVTNETPIAVDNWLDDGNYTKYLIDGSYIKLREVTLGYTIPKSITSKLRMQNASIQLFTKNPKFWLPSENSFADPEVNGPENATSNANGLESTQTPPSRSYGFNLNITF